MIKLHLSCVLKEYIIKEYIKNAFDLDRTGLP